MAFNPMDIVGRKFNRLVVIAYIGKINGHHTYRCACDCSGEKTTRRSYLLSGVTTSCGCYRASIIWRNRTTHGETVRNASGRVDSSEYRAWAAMKERCHNPKHRAYHNYGGRGIYVCDEWLDSFGTFLNDVGRKPSPEHSLERINNDMGYAPGNVVWATRVDQGNNRRTNRIIEFQGVCMTLTQWAAAHGLKKETLHERLKMGWSVEKALTTPVRTLSTHGTSGPLFSSDSCAHIRDLSANGVSRSEIARRLGVTTTTISRVIDKQGAYRAV